MSDPIDAAPVNQALYHRFAAWYDRLFQPYTRQGRGRAIALLALQPGERLLIPGVGTGLDLALIPAGVRVTGVDLSAEMLRQAAAKPGAAQADLLRMDAMALAYPDGAFDAVLLNLILSVAPDGAVVFAEAWRVLRPGGRLAVFDKFLPEAGRLTPLRRAVGRVIAAIGTDPNRRFSELAAGAHGLRLEVDEASLLRGQYRVLLGRKRVSASKAPGA